MWLWGEFSFEGRKRLVKRAEKMNTHYETVILTRDCQALLVPSGSRILLQKDTEVTITQALGGTYTVNIYGNLARIDSKDADALGKQVDASISAEMLENATVEELVWAQLKTCFDPEIPVNIVDLGLVYECIVEAHTDSENSEAEQYNVKIKMTLTAPGCGMGPVIAADVKQKALAVPGVEQAEVEIVFDPPWDREMMSEAAKLQLGIF